MGAGIEIYDPDGNLIVGEATRVVMITGYVETGKVNGSVSVPRLGIGGTPQLIAMIPLEALSFESAPVVTVTTTGLSWTFKVSGASWNGNCLLVHGVS